MSVVVVAASDAERLLRCLAAVAREAGDVAIEVIVVLNAAGPSLHEALDRAAPHARVVVSAVPLGFAGGVNLGARHAGGELLHILHDDTEVCAGWLAPLLAALERHPRAGAAGSLLIAGDGRAQSAGVVLWRDGRTQPPWHDPPPLDELRTVEPHDYCASASLLVRRSAWDAVGGLDEDIHPAQYVDADLGMALRRCGYISVCASRSHVRHGRGGSSSHAMKVFANARNRERFVAKWADELVLQEPFGDDRQALEAARAATLRRAQAVLATRPPAGAARAAAPGREAETETERRLREQRALARELAFKADYIEQLETAAVAAAAEIAEVHRAWAVLQHASLENHALATHALEAARQAASDREAEVAAHLADLRCAGAERESAMAAALAERERAGAERDAALVAVTEELRRRTQTLEAIEAGGWWRLRARLAPLLRAGARVRRIARRP